MLTFVEDQEKINALVFIGKRQIKHKGQDEDEDEDQDPEEEQKKEEETMKTINSVMENTGKGSTLGYSQSSLGYSQSLTPVEMKRLRQ